MSKGLEGGLTYLEFFLYVLKLILKFYESKGHAMQSKAQLLEEPFIAMALLMHCFKLACKTTSVNEKTDC